MTTSINNIINPFPGLRPFEKHEHHLFFGREEQIRELSRKLNRTRFLAVVGTSGSGKSSLIRAGFVPSLEKNAQWHVAIMRPGSDPIGNLAIEINKIPEVNEIADSGEFTEISLRQSSFGLIETIQEHRLKEKILIVVDQFEELFRFKKANREDAIKFVKLLLESSQQREVPIYIILTMRSEYFGNCSEFRGLPQAISDGQYLIPRMTRTNLRDAIKGPINVAGGNITSRLLAKLLNEVGDNPDQLPILQHALMRTWEHWQTNQQKNEDAIDLSHYELIGKMEKALNRHADEAYDELDTQQHRTIAEKLFKCLTEKGKDNREIRRPAKLGEIIDIVESEEKDVIEVIDVFRKPGRSFLMPPATESLDKETLIDISHESLIRNWNRLKKWASDEAESAKAYSRLADTAVRHMSKAAELWSGLDLVNAITWEKKNNPNKIWADRYHPSFEQAMLFLNSSKKKSEHELLIRRVRNIFIGMLVSLIIIGLVLYSLDAKKKQRIKFAKKLASQAELNKNREPCLLESSILLSIEASNILDDLKDNSSSVERVIRRGLDLLPRSFTDMTHENRVEEIIFSPDGNYLATRSGKSAYVWKANTDNNKTEENFKIEHEDNVETITFSPDGEYLATMSKNNVSVWKTDTDTDKEVWEKYEDNVEAITFSPGGKFIAALCEKNVKVFEAITGKETASIEHSEKIIAIVFSQDEKYLAIRGGNVVVLCETNADKEECRMIHGDDVQEIIFSPDGKYLATESGKSIRLYEAGTNTEVDRINLDDDVWQIVFSPKGKYLATASMKTVRVWEVDTRKGVLEKEHEFFVAALLFSPDEKYLATRSGKTVRVWDVDTHKRVLKKEHEYPVVALLFSPHERYLATMGGNTVWVCELTNKNNSSSMTHDNFVKNILFSQEEKYLATRGDDAKTARLWNVNTGKEVIRMIHEGTVDGIAISPDGMYLATMSGKTARLWEANSREVVRLAHAGFVDDITFSPDGKYLATMCENTAILWKANTGTEVVRLEHAGFVDDITFSEDGKHLATKSGNIAQLWDAKTGKKVGVDFSYDDVENTIFSPDGMYLATRSDTIAQLWNINTGEKVGNEIHDDSKDYINSIAFSPGGKYLGAASGNTVLLRIVNTGKAIPGISLSDFIRMFTFSLNEKYLAAVSANTVHLREVNTGKENEVRMVHDNVAYIAFSPDKRYLASGSINNIKLWEISKREEVSHMEFESDDGEFVFNGEFVFSYDGKYIAAMNGKNVQVWESETGKDVSKMEHDDDTVKAITFSPDGKYLTTISGTTAWLWEIATGEEFARMEHDDTVEAITFSPDGKYLTTISGKTASLWCWRLEECLDAVHARLTRNITYHEWKQYMIDEAYRKTIDKLDIHGSYIEEGRRLAKEGKINDAITHFQKALELDKELKLNPETEVYKLAAPALVKIGKELASTGNFEEAIIKFEEANKMDPLLGLNPKEKAWKLAADAFVSMGISLAKEGDYEGGLNKFKEAKKLNPSLEFDSKERARKIAVQALSGIAASLIRAGDNTGGLNKFREAKKLNQELNPEERLQQFDVLQLVEEGKFFIGKGDIEEALTSFKIIEEIDIILQKSGDSWNNLCWDGSLYGYAKEVLFACEKAIDFDSGNGYYRESRGLARVLTGDYEGAIEDLEITLEWGQNTSPSQSKEWLRDREKWIEVLKDNRNPFDDETLKELRE